MKEHTLESVFGHRPSGKKQAVDTTTTIAHQIIASEAEQRAAKSERLKTARLARDAEATASISRNALGK